MPYMQYEANPALGFFGCGRNCQCRQCSGTRALAFAGYGGTPLPAAPPPPAPAQAPAFRFHCPIGCAPHAANQCMGIVSGAIRDAIVLAENAANRLDARTTTAVARFRALFGDPERPVPWANNKLAAELV